MAVRRLARAQRGVALERAVLRGPFLSPGSLTPAERLRLIDGIERILDGVYTHLPLKRARYGFDPVQRLRILRSQIGELSDDAFHAELADTVTRLRDAHTFYTGPASLRNKVAALPFLVEMIGDADNPRYVVTKVARGLGAAFKPGVELVYWNGVPIDRAVLRHGDRGGFGGRPDSLRASALESLTLRPLRYGPPPDEHWVIIGYRPAGRRRRTGRPKEIRLPWQIVDPSQIDPALSEGPTGVRAKALRRTRAIAPAAEAIRRAKMLLFAPHTLTGQARRRRARHHGRHGHTTVRVIPTTLKKVLKAASIQGRGDPVGYLRIYAFDAEPEEFIDELIRLIPLLPDRGLIIDIRGNPGGYIWAAEMALQLFTPNPVEPTRFSALATPFMRRIASIGDVREDLEPWRSSLDAAVRNGELYAQAIPITDPGACNELGQLYGGPVMLVADSSTYSSGDLFSAGFVDNRMGEFICVGSATGAGGANVWYYDELRTALAGSKAALPGLPDGIDLSFSFRRATRVRANEGMPIEDVGISGTPYAMTLDDLLHDNCDLIATCIRRLETQPLSRLTPVVDTRRHTVSVTATRLDRVDARFDGRPGVTLPIHGSKPVTIPYPKGTRIVELEGCFGPDTRQRRRLLVRR